MCLPQYVLEDLSSKHAMLPEAFEMGGSLVGLSTLAGFLTALLVKLI